MAKKIVASDSQDDAGRNMDRGIKSRMAAFHAKFNAANNSLGIVGRANRDAIGKHWELGFWLLMEDKTYAALTKAREEKKRGSKEALSDYRDKLNGKPCLESDLIVIRRSCRIFLNFPGKADAMAQPSVLKACKFQSSERLDDPEKLSDHSDEAWDKQVREGTVAADKRIKEAKDKRAKTVKEKNPETVVHDALLTVLEQAPNLPAHRGKPNTEAKGIADLISKMVSKLVKGKQDKITDETVVEALTLSIKTYMNANAPRVERRKAS